MTAAGLIFANIHDGSLPELTRVRNTASVPFGGRYRLIDFTLSNMVNSGVTRVGVVTHYNYQSLLDHLGTGKDWAPGRGTQADSAQPDRIGSRAPAHLAAGVHAQRAGLHNPLHRGLPCAVGLRHHLQH